MIDIKILRENPELVKKAAEVKGYKVDIERTLELDARRRQLQQKADDLRARRNDVAARMRDGKPEPDQIEEGKRIKLELATLEKDLNLTEEEFYHLFKQIPNLPTEDVPVGASEAENVVVKTVGDKPQFNFEPKNHAEIATRRGWLDKERAVKVAGSRFVYLKGDLVLLEFALWQFAFSVLTNQETLQKIIDENNLTVSAKPFVPVLPPAVAKTKVFEATGRLNKEEQTYKLEDDDLWLNASAEHTLAPMYMDEILDEKDFPLRYVGYTTAFRREAGTYGKDMEGILRLHQFNKLEMESFNLAENSLAEHHFMVAIQEYLMQQLGLPYQVLNKCTADIGFPNARGVDINTWLPGQNKYRETHTADYITDFQARGTNTRVKRDDSSVQFVHNNDATAFSQRPLIAILENYQNEDATVRIPEVLRPFLNNRDLL